MGIYIDTFSRVIHIREDIDKSKKFSFKISKQINYLISSDQSLKYLIHREGGPAIQIFDDYKEWIIDGKYHRLDGPALEWHNGKKFWFYHRKWIYCNSQKEFEKILSMKAFL